MGIVQKGQRFAAKHWFSQTFTSIFRTKSLLTIYGMPLIPSLCMFVILLLNKWHHWCTTVSLIIIWPYSHTVQDGCLLLTNFLHWNHSMHFAGFSIQVSFWKDITGKTNCSMTFPLVQQSTYWSTKHATTKTVPLFSRCTKPSVSFQTLLVLYV